MANLIIEDSSDLPFWTLNIERCMASRFQINFYSYLVSEWWVSQPVIQWTRGLTPCGQLRPSSQREQVNVSIKQSQGLHKSLYSAAAFKKQRAGKTNLFYIRGGRFHAFNTWCTFFSSFFGFSSLFWQGIALICPVFIPRQHWVFTSRYPLWNNTNPTSISL